jgi:hypothetical protein
MEIKPLKRYNKPIFPTREVLDEHPELLRLLPRRWRRHTLILTAVTAVGALAAGCRSQVAAVKAQPGEATLPPAASRVAPIFQHGDGHGFFGGKPAPTYFLTEEEARQVIVEEGKRAGIDFAADGLTLPDVPLPVTHTTSGSIAPLETRRGAIVLDGADTKRQIAYEYVSRDDFVAWQGKDIKRSFVSEENLRAAAQALRDGLAHAKPAGAHGVFYDPIVKSLPDETEGTADLNARTLAPLSLFSWKGWKAQFDEQAGAVTFTGRRTIVLKVGSAQATVDGQTVAMPLAARLRYGSPYLPLKWTAHALGGAVHERAEHRVAVRAPAQGYDRTSQVEEVTLAGAKDRVTVAFAWYDNNTRRGMALETARAEVRAQVRDFITWLKAEGVI